MKKKPLAKIVDEKIFLSLKNLTNIYSVLLTTVQFSSRINIFITSRSSQTEGYWKLKCVDIKFAFTLSIKLNWQAILSKYHFSISGCILIIPLFCIIFFHINIYHVDVCLHGFFAILYYIEFQYLTLVNAGSWAEFRDMKLIIPSKLKVAIYNPGLTERLILPSQQEKQLQGKLKMIRYDFVPLKIPFIYIYIYIDIVVGAKWIIFVEKPKAI